MVSKQIATANKQISKTAGRKLLYLFRQCVFCLAIIFNGLFLLIGLTFPAVCPK